MSGDRPDESQKTEEPTAKRLEDAHKKGDVPKSQEISNWFILAAGTAALVFMVDGTTARVTDAVMPFIESPHMIPTDGHHIVEASRLLILDLVVALLFPLGLFVIAAIAGNMIQHPPIFTTEKMQPKLEKISPISGFKRIFGTMALVNFAKGLAKLTIVGLIATVIVASEQELLMNILRFELNDTMDAILGLAIRMMGGILAVLAVIAILDFAYQQFDFTKRQRMTKQEVKDEHKQMEGDPMVKARLRQIRMERSRQRMMAEVPEASVVITNPTHYAVALKYESGTMHAPLVVAKGVDAVALRIREMAGEHDVPIVENPPLARSLHASVELGEEIDPDHYKAVAAVISYVMQKNANKARARTH